MEVHDNMAIEAKNINAFKNQLEKLMKEQIIQAYEK